jgi:hypothetical protein
VVADVAGRFDLTVLEPPIPKSVRFAEAPASGHSVLVTANKVAGAAAYREHAKALVASPSTVIDLADKKRSDKKPTDKKPGSKKRAGRSSAGRRMPA